jgi:hypothetical protein
MKPCISCAVNLTEIISFILLCSYECLTSLEETLAVFIDINNSSQEQLIVKHKHECLEVCSYAL